MNKVLVHVNSLFGTLIRQLLANATNVEYSFLASETLMNHMNVNVINIHLTRTVNLKTH